MRNVFVVFEKLVVREHDIFRLAQYQHDAVIVRIETGVAFHNSGQIASAKRALRKNVSRDFCVWNNVMDREKIDLSIELIFDFDGVGNQKPHPSVARFGKGH